MLHDIKLLLLNSSSAKDEALWEQNLADSSLEGGGCGRPNAIVAFAALADEKVVELLDFYKARCPRVRGIRQLLNWHDKPEKRFADRPNIMDDPAFHKVTHFISPFSSLAHFRSDIPHINVSIRTVGWLID
jgi:hypothetical protein